MAGMTQSTHTRPSLVGQEGIFRFSRLQKFPYLLQAITRRRAPNICEQGKFDFRADGQSRAEHARKCRSAFAKMLDINLGDTVWFDPAEAGKVRWVSAEELGSGAEDWDTRLQRTSGIVCQCTNLFLCTLATDNTIIVLLDPRWYGIGLVSLEPMRPTGVPIEEAVELMLEKTDARRDEIIGFIASGVGPCCHTFNAFKPGDTRGQSNMWDLARATMLQSGLNGDNILNSRTCTACRDTEFFTRRVDGPAAGANAVLIGVKDDGAFSNMIAARTARAAEEPIQHAQEDENGDEPGLLMEERRLNASMRCPYGENKVYVRSLFDGLSDTTSEPVIVLRCDIMQYVGHAGGGYNVVDKDYIEEYCCGDYKACPSYRLFLQQRRRR